MGQINFLNSLPKNREYQKGIAQILVLTVAIALLPHRTTPKMPGALVSKVIPSLVAAPTLSRVDRLEGDLKNRTIAEKSLTLNRAGNNGSGVEIILSSDSLFQSGTAAFDGKIEPELRNLVQWLTARNDGFRVTVESHTDDTPIVKHRKTFRTNWDLSAARAGAVAGVFQESSFPKSDLEAIGLADSRPVGSDRNLNRRIVLRITDQVIPFAPRGGT